MNSHNYIVHFSFGGKMVYVKSKDGSLKTSDRNQAYRFLTIKQASETVTMLKEIGFGSAEFETIKHN